LWGGRNTKTKRKGMEENEKETIFKMGGEPPSGRRKRKERGPSYKGREISTVGFGVVRAVVAQSSLHPH
jgi:hypothetical protein